MEGKEGRKYLRLRHSIHGQLKDSSETQSLSLGGYSASPKGEDTQEILGIDFSKQKEYHDFSGLERKVVDLIRRKMLVSQYRAVEQLIILNTHLSSN